MKLGVHGGHAEAPVRSARSARRDELSAHVIRGLTPRRTNQVRREAVSDLSADSGGGIGAEPDHLASHHAPPRIEPDRSRAALIARPIYRPSAVHRQTLLPCGSARTVNAGASSSYAIVPPAARPALMRSGTTSGGSQRSRWNRCRGVECGEVPWNQRFGT